MNRPLTNWIAALALGHALTIAIGAVLPSSHVLQPDWVSVQEPSGFTITVDHLPGDACATIADHIGGKGGLVTASCR